ncbi:unnamed protein product, partial [Brenthis ino]
MNMIVELCLILRIVLNENQHYVFQGGSVHSCKATNDVKNMHTPSTKMSSSDYISTPDTWESNPDLKSLWVYRPPSILPHQPDIAASQHTVLKPRHLITKLAKPLFYGFDPFFERRAFEPFERRQKPVSLVAFRKNGIEPRQTINVQNKESAEVAEIQSSFNDIGSFWHDLPGVR